MDSKEIIDLIYEMYPDARCELDYDSPFMLLCAIVLSAQTTDKHVNKITPILFNKYRTIKDLADANIEDIIETIKPLGLSKNKSKYLKDLSNMIINKYNGEIPRNIEELEKLPGVGHKTASVYLSEYYKEPHIAVDTHVFRVSNRLGLTNSKDVIETEKVLMKFFDKEDYIKAHIGLLFLGRYCCKSKNPSCLECKLTKCCKKWSIENGN